MDAISAGFICGSLSIDDVAAALYKGWAVSEDGKRFQISDLKFRMEKRMDFTARMLVNVAVVRYAGGRSEPRPCEENARGGVKIR